MPHLGCSKGGQLLGETRRSHTLVELRLEHPGDVLQVGRIRRGDVGEARLLADLVEVDPELAELAEDGVVDVQEWVPVLHLGSHDVGVVPERARVRARGRFVAHHVLGLGHDARGLAAHRCRHRPEDLQADLCRLVEQGMQVQLGQLPALEQLHHVLDVVGDDVDHHGVGSEADSGMADGEVLGRDLHRRPRYGERGDEGRESRGGAPCGGECVCDCADRLHNRLAQPGPVEDEAAEQDGEEEDPGAPPGVGMVPDDVQDAVPDVVGGAPGHGRPLSLLGRQGLEDGGKVPDVDGGGAAVLDEGSVLIARRLRWALPRQRGKWRE